MMLTTTNQCTFAQGASHLEKEGFVAYVLVTAIVLGGVHGNEISGG